MKYYLCLILINYHNVDVPPPFNKHLGTSRVIFNKYHRDIYKESVQAENDDDLYVGDDHQDDDLLNEVSSTRIKSQTLEGR